VSTTLESSQDKDTYADLLADLLVNDNVHKSPRDGYAVLSGNQVFERLRFNELPALSVTPGES